MSSTFPPAGPARQRRHPAVVGQRAPSTPPLPSSPSSPPASAGAGPAGEPARPLGTAVAVVVLARVAPRARLWGFAQYVVGRFALWRQPGLRFYKVLGSGQGGGFGLRPSASHMGLFLLFDDASAAACFLERSAAVRRWRARCDEFFSVRLHAYSSRGSWAGMVIEPSAPPPTCGAVAVLTRAAIRPRRALSFWRHQPAAEAALSAAPGCRLAAGLGEAPLLRQATFSLWDDARQLDAYARSAGHGSAARAAWRDGFFSESMFVRFVPSDAQGVWQGSLPWLMRRHWPAAASARAGTSAAAAASASMSAASAAGSGR